jgi:hypothetical protein
MKSSNRAQIHTYCSKLRANHYPYEYWLMAYGDGFVINLLYVFYCDAPEKKNPWLLSFLDHRLNNHNYNLINTVLQVYQTAWFSYNLIHLFHNIGFLEQYYGLMPTSTPLRITLFALFNNLVHNFIPHVQDLIKLFGNSRPNSNSLIQSSDVKNERTTMVDNHAAKPRAGPNGTWL